MKIPFFLYLKLNIYPRMKYLHSLFLNIYAKIQVKKANSIPHYLKILINIHLIIIFNYVNFSINA